MTHEALAGPCELSMSQTQKTEGSDPKRVWPFCLFGQWREQMDKHKKEVCSRLIASVCEYFGAFNKPMGMSMLSMKYSKTLQRYGGFSRVLSELADSGMLHVSLRPTGGKDVWPKDAPINLVDGSVLLTKKRGE